VFGLGGCRKVAVIKGAAAVTRRGSAADDASKPSWCSGMVEEGVLEPCRVVSPERVLDRPAAALWR
jgi:hypothetical protein